MRDATSMCYDYFCTVGGGLEHFCSKELLRFGLTNVSEVSEGKVFFSSSLPVHKLLSLRIPERLFLLVHKEPQFLISHPMRKAILMLRDVIERDSCSKLDCSLKKWRDFPCSSKCTNLDELSFRVSCKSYGEIKRVFPPAFLGKIIAGSLLNIRQTWSTDLRNPLLEVLVHAKYDTLIVGLACCPMNFPLSKRPYLPSTMSSTFLRPTVCSALIDCGLSTYKKLPQEKKGLEMINSPTLNKQHLVILDPMCGSGMILAEAVSILKDKNITLLGSDIDRLQVEIASRNILNVENHSKQKKVSDELSPCKQCVSNLFVSDARALPLKDNSVDVIISDVPFGLKHYSYPWKKESSYLESTKYTSEANECQQFEPVHCYQLESNVIPLHAGGNEVQDIAPKPFIKLDATVEKDAKGTSPKPESVTQIKDASEEVSHPSKRRKLEDKNNHFMGVDSTKNMLPNLVKELDRVLKSGGQSVLLVSENLKIDLLSAVNKVTKPDNPSRTPDCSSKIIKSIINDEATVAIEEVVITNYDESNSKVSTKSQYEWVPIEQHPVKLGMLDAVICVFGKQCVNE
ncbi:hypothetical protein J437_LFUL016726 [Ladona fulva]|uniref:Ribosomal RNA large subunit methyltransferase K/L-like methyltransferase domain-containing protein n=1 Tax=Ladona fulva TaxID=123851 RepID=A0A8K0PAM5_LADFU|nr:hypothetical protein J437_LFUL016726 [Ladona fulva]